MQLISTLLLAFSLLLLFGSIVFVALWHNARSKISIMYLLREGIGHVGISTIIEYPETSAPLLALLEEEYPRSEAIVVTDLQQHTSPFCELVHKFHMVRVNHTHLQGVRALYRSRHRAYRRVVLVDMSVEHRSFAYKMAQKVASYNYVLHLLGESVIARNALTYCANIIASHDITRRVSLESIVGADAHLELCNAQKSDRSLRLRADKALAWRKERYLLPFLVLCAPAVTVFIAHFLGSGMLLMVAISISMAVAAFMYISCRVMSEKSIFATLDAILRNFYGFLIDGIKKIRYLYEESDYRIKPLVKRVESFTRRGKNRQQL